MNRLKPGEARLAQVDRAFHDTQAPLLMLWIFFTGVLAAAENLPLNKGDFCVLHLTGCLLRCITAIKHYGLTGYTFCAFTG